MAPTYPALPARARRPLQKVADARRGLTAARQTWENYLASVEMDCVPMVDLARGLTEWTFSITSDPPRDELERDLRAVVSDCRSAFENALTALGQEQGLARTKLRNLKMPRAMEAKDWPEAEKKSLSGLSRAVIGRVRDLQPFSRPTTVAQFHPLVFIADADNDNKHALGLTTELKPTPTFGRKISSAKIELEEGLNAAQMEAVRAAIVALVNHPFQMTAWNDGDVVWRHSLPPHVTSAHFDPLDVELSLVIDTEPAHHSMPALPMLDDAVTWAQEAISYLMGIRDAAPVSTVVRRNPRAP